MPEYSGEKISFCVFSNNVRKLLESNEIQKPDFLQVEIKLTRLIQLFGNTSSRRNIIILKVNKDDTNG